MDCKTTQPRAAKEKLFFQKYNAWKEKRQADQTKGSSARPKPTKSCFPAKAGSGQKRGAVLQTRRQTFEIPANLRNSPIPLKMLPRIGRPERTCDKENRSRLKSALPTATLASVEKDQQPANKRRGAGLKPPKTSHSSPFIRQTKTSLARIAAAPGQNGEYLERFRQWKEGRKDVGVKSKPSARSEQSSTAARHVHVQRETKSDSSRSRRKTIAGNGEEKNAGFSLKRRQTIAHSNGRQMTQLLDRRNQHDSNLKSAKQRQIKQTITRPPNRQDYSGGKRRVSLAEGRSTVKRRQTIDSQRCVRSSGQHAPDSQPLKRKSMFTSRQTEKKRCVRTPQKRSQASMREDLRQWLAARGRTPSRCRHMMCYGAHVTEKGAGSLSSTKPLLSVDELSQQQRALELESQRASGSEVNRQLEPILRECLELHDTVHLTIHRTRKSRRDFTTSGNNMRLKENVSWTLLFLHDVLRSTMFPKDVILEGTTTHTSDCDTSAVAISGSGSHELSARSYILKLVFDNPQNGCPAEMLLVWMDSLQENLPAAVVSALFWICRAKLTLASGNKNEVLQIFEEAVRRQAKPSDLLATELTSIVKAMTEGSYHYTSESDPDNSLTTGNEGTASVPQTPARTIPSAVSTTPARSATETQNGDVFESSAIKYCVKEKTPLLKRMMETLGTGAASPCVITPVRRSTRRSLATIPESLREKDRVFSCVDALPVEAQTRGLYQANPALTAAL